MQNPLFKHHSCLNKSKILNTAFCCWLFYICKAAYCQTSSFTCAYFFQLRKTFFSLLYNSRRTCGLKTKNGKTELLWLSQNLTIFDWITVFNFQLSERENNPWNIQTKKSLKVFVMPLYLVIPDFFCMIQQVSLEKR